MEVSGQASMYACNFKAMHDDVEIWPEDVFMFLLTFDNGVLDPLALTHTTDVEILFV